MRNKIYNKDASTLQRIAVIEAQHRQRAAQLADDVSQRAAHSQSVLAGHRKQRETRIAHVQVRVLCVRMPCGSTTYVGLLWKPVGRDMLHCNLMMAREPDSIKQQQFC